MILCSVRTSEFMLWIDSVMLYAKWNTVKSLKDSAEGLTWSPDPSLAWNSSVIEWCETFTVVPFKVCVLPKTFSATAKTIKKKVGDEAHKDMNQLMDWLLKGKDYWIVINIEISYLIHCFSLYYSSAWQDIYHLSFLEEGFCFLS